MATTKLNNINQTITTGLGSIVIVDNFQSIRGGRSLDVTGFAPLVIQAGHVIIMETATKEYKPLSATDTRTLGAATLGTLVQGTGYTAGTYENVPLSGGTGTGALATVVSAAGVVSSISITFTGSGYTVGDVLSVPGFFAGGTATTLASAPVATVATFTGVYGALPAAHTYAGILINAILTAKPFAGIMVRGTVNPAAAPYSMTSILAAVKTALPLIDFRED